jgi:hypothetical protein
MADGYEEADGTVVKAIQPSNSFTTWNRAFPEELTDPKLVQ